MRADQDHRGEFLRCAVAMALTARLLSAAVGSGPPDEEAPAARQQAAERYEKADALFDAGRIAEARELLEGLLEEHPQHCLAHLLYWRAVGRTGEPGARLEAVRASLARFEQVPDAERDEEFYNVFMDGARILGNTTTVEALRAEVVKRFPRGLEAQLQVLHAAEAEQDPMQGSEMYRSYIERFPDNVSWTQSAARDRFELMGRHPDRFTVDELVAAAEQFDALSVAYIPVYGNPTIRLHALTRIGTVLLQRDPAQTIRFADRGVEFVQATAPQTDEFDEDAAQTFRALRLLAARRLERWSEVREVAGRLLKNVESGLAVTVNPWLPFAEADLRLAYAEALAAAGEVEPAREQLWLAAALDESLVVKRDALPAAHQLTEQDRCALEARARLFLERRAEVQRKEFLAGERCLPAPEFSLPSLAGGRGSLGDLRGKVVVLDFFATWCGPCVAELKELKKAWLERYRDHAVIVFLLISVDAEKDKVAPFTETHGLPFEVLYADGKIDGEYLTGGGIPQLYVIDRQGRIRFQVTGFDLAHFHEHLDWMIAAALAECP